MAEDKKEAAPPAKEHKEGATAATPKKGGGAMGAVLAGVVLLAVGAGVGVAGASLVAKWSTSSEAHGDGAEAAAKAKEKEKAAGSHAGKGLHGMHEVQLTDIKSNIKNQQGRRYIMVACSIYISDADALTLGFAGGGGHGGGGDAGGNIKRIIQGSLEEHLKTYDIEELTGNPYPALKKGFRDSIERALHEVFPDTPDDHHFVERVVLNSLLVQ